MIQSIRKRFPGFVFLALLSGLYLLANCIFFPWFGGTDLYSFKDPGVNLAIGRGFVGENLPTMPQGMRALYLEYTPLYPFLFGVWSKITGIGLSQATVFNAFIDILRTFILYLVAREIIQSYRGSEGKGLFPRNSGKADMYAAGLSALTLPLRTGYGDRPDDLAVSFQMLILYFSMRKKRNIPTERGLLVQVALVPGKREFFICGVCAGLTFLTSPSIGLFAVILVASVLSVSGENPLNEIRFPYILKNFLSSAAGFLGTLAPAAAVYLLLDPGAFFRFRRHGSRFVLQGFDSLLHGDPSVFSEQLSWAWRVGHAYILFAIIELLIAAVAITLISKRARLGPARRYLLGVLVALLVSTAVHFAFFTPQFIYLWSVAFISGAIIVAFVSSLACFSASRRTAGALLLGVLISISGVFAVSGVFWIEAFQRPSSQTPEVNKAKLLESIPKGNWVLATPVHYWLLKRDYNIANPDTIKEWSDYNYLVISCNGTGSPGKPYVPVHSGENDFDKSWKLVRNTLNSDPLSLFGIRISNSAWGYGFALYRRKVPR